MTMWRDEDTVSHATPEQVQFYRDNGYLKFGRIFTCAEMEALREHVDEMIAAGDNGVLVPLRDIDLNRIMGGELPEGAFGVEHDLGTVETKDAAALFLVGHTGMLDGGVDIALITGDDPRSDLG